LNITGPGVPRPGVLDEGLTAAAIAKEANDGIAQYGVPDCKRALQLLTPAVAKIERNPALLVVDTSNLDLTFKARGTIAVCDARQGDERAAKRAMREAIRVSSQRPISRNDMWGPEGEKLYRDTMAEAQTLGRGQLSIAAGDLDAAIFVDGQLRGMGHANIADMIPGTAHVFIRPPGNGPGNVGRQYEVEVKANDTTSLIVDAKLDNIIWITDAYAALVFAGAEEQSKLEAKLATDFSQRWAGSDIVVLVSPETLPDGHSAAVARLVQGGREKRAARVPLDGTSRGLASLAKFLADGQEGPGMDVLRTDTVAVRIGRTKGAPWWAKTLTIGSAAVMLGSTGLYLAWPEDDHMQPEYDDKKSLAVELYSGAAIVGGVGLYGWLTSRGMRRRTAVMFSAATTSFLLAAMLVPTDQDDFAQPPGYYQRQYYRDTVLLGVVLAGAGVGFVTVGYMFARGERSGTYAPAISFTRDGASFGWVGRF
jgi:hypothetical protein